MVSATGQVVAQQRYLPFGGVRWRSGTLPTDRQYTGQRWDDALDLYDYKARYYDPALGRFIQPDTLVPRPGDPQALNRYAYVRNNPLRYTDPSGHCWGVASFIRGLPGYDVTCNNLDMALTIVQSDRATAQQKALAWGYITLEGGTHTALLVGTGILAWEGTPAAIGALGTVQGAAVASTTATAACADGDCANEAKIVTHGFWSGGEIAKNAAQQWALENNGITLEMTDIGKQLEQISQGLDWFTEARPLWIQASRNFALEASGEVHVFQVAERGVSLQSIWATIEYPTLLTNPRVTAIIYHVVMPDGNVITLP